ncbi:sporulation protein [Antribacter sp. KLBMP9083]|uniref:Sporulation protein n=1 Tax=Antribacter soli TaxID=2910976 RepID=A0AA41QJL3_9MICO|nr:sporulation protein [Antribacter soli]MCF4119685.1 sporulation protein [Antribacter soli]MCF4123447.1 sporulation protein [Antribacter soli]
MVFKKLLGALGVGGPMVDTVLEPVAVRPGGTVNGEVRLKGGASDVEVQHVTLELEARVEAEHGGGESRGTVTFGRITVAGGFRLGADEERTVPFSFPLHPETPLNELDGRPIGVGLGLRTELAIAQAVDKGDLDPLRVAPLPIQEAILDAFWRLGFGFRSADLEYGRLHGVAQQLPFFQEIELMPPAQYARQINEVELTFVAGPHSMDVILEADKRGGYFGGGQDSVLRITVGLDERRDWVHEVEGWVGQLAERRSMFGGHAGHRGLKGHGHGGHGGGVGLGGVVGGVAAGVVGGMVLGEMFDEVGDLFGGDFAEE